MRYIKEKHLFFLVLYAFISFSIHAVPTKAASALAAWLISSDGVLTLRTSPYTKLEAFYQSGKGYIGDRVWIDFPGELSRPRKINGNGPIKQIRLGKPYKGSTRLVIEFNSNISINPYKLKLKGVSPNLWKLPLVETNKNQFVSIGEGNIVKPSTSKHKKITRSEPFYRTLNSSSLPDVQRDRFLIVIDPGHGGPDTGAVGINGLKETNIVLEISKYISKFLSDKGVQVKLTRHGEIDLDLSQRVNIANRSRADAFVSVHANASRGKRRDISGIETFFHSGFNGKNLAIKIQNSLLSLPGGSPNRGVRQSRFYVIGKTNMPAALVEVGFVTGKLDANLLSQKNHRKEIAFAISKGILQYLKETY